MMSDKIMKPIYIFKCWDSYFNPNIKCSEGFDGYENAKVVKCYTKIGVLIKKLFYLFFYDYHETILDEI